MRPSFTLLELLVVLLLLALTAGLASAISRRDDHHLLPRVKAERLAQWLELGAAESHLPAGMALSSLRAEAYRPPAHDAQMSPARPTTW